MSLLTGCATGSIDILNSKGKIVGQCEIGFDWHWYGLDDSIDYGLNTYCAEWAASKGENLRIASKSPNKDYSLPEPPAGKSWNRKLAYEQFKKGNISEQKYGYILAAVEFIYVKKIDIADERLAKGDISLDEHEKILSKERFVFYGE